MSVPVDASTAPYFARPRDHPILDRRVTPPKGIVIAASRRGYDALAQIA